MDLVRGGAFVAALLLVWVSLHPFTDLGNVLLVDLTNGNETYTYAAFGCLAILTMSLVIRDNIPGLKSLMSPGYILFGGWVVVTVLLSLDPGASITRFVLSTAVIAVAA